MGGLTKYWFVIYVMSAALVLAGFLLFGQQFGPGVEAWAMEKLVPTEWHPVVDDVVHRLFRNELRAFMVTTGFGLGIILIGMTLFPLKEKLSSSYERERFPDLARGKELPLWRQGLEEVKLAGLYLLLQAFSLYLALQGFKTVSMLLSIWYLVLAMSLDHCAPFFQRRGRKIHGILWILMRKALLPAILIGVVFVGPVILLEKLLPSSLNPAAAISLLVLTEVLGMACATLAGCYLGARLIEKEPKLAEREPPKRWTVFYRVNVLALAVLMAVFFGWWGKGVLSHYHLRQCKYRPLWTDTGFKIRETTIIIDLPVEVRNRSAGTIDPSELLIEIKGGEALQSDVIVSGPKIGPGETSSLNLEFAVELSEEALLDLPRFLQAKYSAQIRLQPPLSKPVLIPIFGKAE